MAILFPYFILCLILYELLFFNAAFAINSSSDSDSRSSGSSGAPPSNALKNLKLTDGKSKIELCILRQKGERLSLTTKQAKEDEERRSRHTPYTASCDPSLVATLHKVHLLEEKKAKRKHQAQWRALQQIHNSELHFVTRSIDVEAIGSGSEEEKCRRRQEREILALALKQAKEEEGIRVSQKELTLPKHGDPKLIQAWSKMKNLTEEEKARRKHHKKWVKTQRRHRWELLRAKAFDKERKKKEEERKKKEEIKEAYKKWREEKNKGKERKRVRMRLPILSLATTEEESESPLSDSDVGVGAGAVGTGVRGGRSSSPEEALVLHYSEEGEPPDNNESIPPWMPTFSGDTDDNQDPPPNDNHADKKKGSKGSAQSRPPHNTQEQKESFQAIQKVVYRSMKDLLEALKTIRFNSLSCQSSPDTFFRIFTTASFETIPSIKIGVLQYSLSRKLSVGLSYGFARHKQERLGVPKKIGFVKAKTSNHLASGIISWNPCEPGLVVSIQTGYCFGNALVSRHTTHAREKRINQGNPRNNVFASSFYVGYGITRNPTLRITPYGEYILLYGKTSHYKENGFYHAKIRPKTAKRVGGSLGVNICLTPTDKTQIRLWFDGTRIRGKSSKISSTISMPYASNHIKIPSDRSLYFQKEVGLEATLGLRRNLNAALSVVARNIDRFMDKRTIQLSFQYDF